jgi:hypothetical protein
MSGKQAKRRRVDDANEDIAATRSNHRFGVHKYSDLVLRVGDVNFHVHKSVIVQHSSVIGEMLDAVDSDDVVDGVVTLELPSVVPSALLAVFVSLYDESVPLVINAIVNSVGAEEAFNAANDELDVQVVRVADNALADYIATTVADGFATLRALAYVAHAYDIKRAHAAISAFLVDAMANGTVADACKFVTIAEQFKIDITSLQSHLACALPQAPTSSRSHRLSRGYF